MEPTRNANEARKEAEGESPDVKPHASFRATQRTSAGGGKGSEVNSARVQRSEGGLKSVTEARQPVSNSPITGYTAIPSF